MEGWSALVRAPGWPLLLLGFQRASHQAIGRDRQEISRYHTSLRVWLIPWSIQTNHGSTYIFHHIYKEETKRLKLLLWRRWRSLLGDHILFLHLPWEHYPDWSKKVGGTLMNESWLLQLHTSLFQCCEKQLHLEDCKRCVFCPLTCLSNSLIW